MIRNTLQIYWIYKNAIDLASRSRWKVRFRLFFKRKYKGGFIIVLGNNGNTACHLEELDIVGFMIDSCLKLSHEQHEPDWQNFSLEHFALISAN